MASRSGRRGDFSPEAKELIHTAMSIDDDERKEPAADRSGKKLQPRRASRSSPAPLTSAASIPEADARAPAKRSVTAEYDGGSPTNVSAIHAAEEGCKVCHKDVDHANLLLCEACNDEYHTYCLNPPLQAVPEGDFFCDKCKRIHAARGDDGLDSLVSALPPTYTSRFGEIVWAAGGVGFGWWPACIYDPRLTVGGARQLARKNLGKRHLIYFFECNEAPFTVLGDSRLTKWDDGFVEEYDLGKVAKSGGKNRYAHFERALHVAQLEHGRPIDIRMDWNHQEAVPPPKIHKQKQITSPAEQPKKQLFSGSPEGQPKKKQKPSPPLKRPALPGSIQKSSVVNRKNLNAAVNALNNRAASKSNNRGEANAIEQSEDGVLVCKILRRFPTGREVTTEGVERSNNLGFVTLPSRQSATFATIRNAVESDLDEDMLPFDDMDKKRWKFYVPKLGPMSMKQEEKIGPALEFLRSTTEDPNIGNGTASNPLKIVLMDW
ncbi:hypothetical protein ACHAWF_010482 [Thalassiosira exigua]